MSAELLTLESLGFPAGRSETWKYTPVSNLVQARWRRGTAGPSADQLAKLADIACGFADDFEVITFFNGQLVGAWPQGLAPDKAAPLGNPVVSDKFAEVLWANAGMGIRMRVRSSLSKPLLILQGIAGEEVWAALTHTLVLEKGVKLAVAEMCMSLDNQRQLATTGWQVQLDEGAHVDWLRVQQEASHTFLDMRAELGPDSRMNWTQIQTGPTWSRSQVEVHLLGERAEAAMQGLTFAQPNQHHDQRVVAHHQHAGSVSRQLFKSVVSHQGRSVVNGRVWIAPGAQKVDARQYTHSLLLGPSAEAINKPELEVYADDVKANHGATIGRLDDDKLFYLQSRAISLAEARHLLASAFVADLLMKVEQPVLRRLASVVTAGRLA